MHRTVVKSEISNIRVTHFWLNDPASITIDQDVLDAADILPGEVVSVLCEISGMRSEQHVVAGCRGSGTVAIKAVGGQRVEPGDRLVVISYALVTDAEARRFAARRVGVDGANRVVHGAAQPEEPAAEDREPAAQSAALRP
ncbi:aspartate 1-decarboxylase [uncultured Jatrophihabitans sp.]|uniref:aspartate 1-decarboxylase n=1 Tax=uncultured Jatrophihabitans sp. TaxID=1610747 RepID=UPI0035CC6394